MAFKDQTFQERGALAAQAKQAALDKLRARPPVDEAVAAERGKAAAAKAEEVARLSAEKKAAREQATADKKAAKELAIAEQAARDAAAAEAAKPYKPALPSEAEMKAARDARYAARKANRK